MLLSSTISLILRKWLHFPPPENDLAVELLDIVLSHSLTSILFLDKIWEMYKDPFLTVFNNDWDIHRSKTKLTVALKNFEKEFSSHPFANTSSLSYAKLKDLSEFINQWMEYTSIVDSNTSEIVSRINSIMIERY
jgi:hypothetical protein